jgi:adenylate kinase
MTKLVLFVGTPGAGKSTLLEATAERFKGNFRIVNLGDVLLDIAKKRFGITDREELGKLNNDDIKIQREMAFKEIIEGKTDAIIDTHLTVKFGRRYVPGVTLSELEKIRIKAIIYVDATAEEIWKRRHKDPEKMHRRNVNDTIGEIEEQRSMNLAILSSCSISLGIPIYIVYNAEGKIEETAVEIGKILEEHFSVKEKVNSR